MAATSGSALALAARLRALDDHALERLVAQRAVRDSRIHDFFDLAEALLDRTSIQAALERLDRGTLALLAVAGELTGSTGAPTAAQLADRLGIPASDVAQRAEVAIRAGLLAEESGRYAPWDAVVEQLGAWPSFGLPAATELLDVAPPAALEPVSEADARFVDRGAGDRAFGTLAAVTEILLAVREEPARRLSRGGVALPDARRLATAAAVEPDAVETLLDIAGRAGLVDDAADWTTTDAATAWLAAPRVERWGTLATGWLDRLPDELHELLRQRAHAVWGDGLLDYLAWRYPAGGDWIRGSTRQAAHEAEMLGITGASTPSTPGAALLEHGTAAAVAAMATLFPADVEHVYVQHDLSIIAPGPLAAAIDSRLRTIADIDGRGLATSYRVTASSITRGLTTGETADSIREFLSEISLTGIPQPLEYLLADTSARFGTLRVGALDPGAAEPDLVEAGIANAASYVRSADNGSGRTGTALLDQLVVDPNLAPLGLQRVGERVVSRFDAAIVFWTLADARYPVVAENAAGEITELRRERRAGAGGGTGDDTVSILVQRVRAGAAIDADETEQGWMTRQLELAIRTKLPVSVSVHLPSGIDIEYLLEPTGLANGRLRARDRKADIERTLPLSSITAVSPLE